MVRQRHFCNNGQVENGESIGTTATQAGGILVLSPSLKNACSVEGRIEPQQVGQTSIEENEENTNKENNDGVLRSVQIVAAQTCRAVVEASQQTRPRKRKRGDVCCRKLINLMPGEKLTVEFDMDCRPVADNSSIFTYFLGQTVRNRTCCPLCVKEWKDIEEHYIEFAWNVVLEKFTMDQQEMRKEFILKHMNALYRDYRRKLKKIFYDCPDLINQAQREKKKPPKVMKSDWLYLCGYWHSPEFKKLSERNRGNKSGLKTPHYSGTKSFARIADELEETETC